MCQSVSSLFPAPEGAEACSLGREPQENRSVLGILEPRGGDGSSTLGENRRRPFRALGVVGGLQFLDGAELAIRHQPRSRLPDTPR